MRAIVIKQYGGPDVLAIEERPDPEPKAGHVVIEVKAFGLNHAEVYFRRGAWGDVAEISGIECVGLVRSDPDGRFAPGQKVMAIVGGMGRSLNGSYAELVRVPASNVAAITSDLPWDALAAIPESYATAWTALIGILALAPDQTVAIRGATSALGQAAVNIAAQAGARVIATTRNASRAAMLQGLGACDVLLEAPDLANKLRERMPQGIDAVLDIVGNTTILDSPRPAAPRRPCLSRRLSRRRRPARPGTRLPDPERPAPQRLRQRARHGHAGLSAVGDPVPDDRRARRRRRLQGKARAGPALRPDPGRPSPDGDERGRRQDRGHDLVSRI